MPAFKIPELLAYRLGCLLAQYEVARRAEDSACRYCRASPGAG
jgi:hypothetical protein